MSQNQKRNSFLRKTLRPIEIISLLIFSIGLFTFLGIVSIRQTSSTSPVQSTRKPREHNTLRISSHSNTRTIETITTLVENKSIKFGKISSDIVAIETYNSELTNKFLPIEKRVILKSPLNPLDSLSKEQALEIITDDTSSITIDDILFEIQRDTLAEFNIYKDTHTLYLGTIEDLTPERTFVRINNLTPFDMNYPLVMGVEFISNNSPIEFEVQNNSPTLKPPIQLVGVGDIMLSRSVEEMMQKNDDNTLPFLNTNEYLSGFDVTFGNLESPYSDKGGALFEGMSFKAMPDSIQGLLLAEFDVLDLANNHFGNQGTFGMEYTYEHLSENNISYYGAGYDDTEAYSPLYYSYGDQTIAFVGYNDIPPFSYGATNEKPGSAIASNDAITSVVTEASKNADFVIVSFHAGTEYTPYPTTRQIQFSHLAISSGADLVISTHPHVVQAIEYFQGVPIIYSLGNFVFDQMWSRETQQGMVAEIYLQSTEHDLSLQTLRFKTVHIYDFNQPSFTDLSESDEIMTRITNVSI